VLVFGFVEFVAFMALKYLWRLSDLGVRRVPGVSETLDSWRATSADAGRRVWTALSPTTIADLFFIGTTAASLYVLWLFRDFITAVTTYYPGSSDIVLLDCWHFVLHQSYQRSVTLLIIGILLAWRGVYGYLRTQGGVSTRIGASMWGSLGCTVILLLMVTMPWQLLHDNHFQRARLDGERAYILRENTAELVIYVAGTESTKRYPTEQYPRDEDVGLERLGVDGYVFEGSIAFDEGRDPNSICEVAEQED